MTSPARNLADAEQRFVNTAGDTMTGGLTLGGALNLGSTGQIVFPATQNPSSNANTLDDYEEGTWTPVLTPTFGSVSISNHTQQFGRYTKIGRLVVCNFKVIATKSGVGNVGVYGLPFVAPGEDFEGGGCYGTARERNLTGSLYQMESVAGTGVVVVRRFDNAGLPDGTVGVDGFFVYYTSS